MSCCGGKRAESANVPASRMGEPTVSAPRVRRLEYLGQSPIQVRGASSGRSYQFSPQRRVRDVAPSDALTLLRTGYFRPA